MLLLANGLIIGIFLKRGSAVPNLVITVLNSSFGAYQFKGQSMISLGLVEFMKKLKPRISYMMQTGKI